MGIRGWLDNWRYFGIGPEEYHKSLRKTFPDNIHIVYKTNMVVAFFSFSFAIFRYFIDSTAYVTMGMYTGAGFIALALIFTAKQNIKQRRQEVNNWFIYVLIIIYYLNIILLGIYIGVWANPGNIAGLFLCILVCALFLFDIPAMLTACLTLGAALLFMVLCIRFKPYDTWILDCSNAVFAGFAGIYFGWHIVKSRIAKSLISTEADAANHAKSVFLANMSHEIRTPMNSIIGFSELAMYDPISPKTRDYLMKIHENSEWLLQLVNDILDISKIESGKMEVENIPFDLHEIFIACRTMILPKAIEKGLMMHFYAEPSIGKSLYGDPIKLHQVLANLLGNAVKFTNTGTIKMLGTVKSTTADSVTMHFEIKDSGIGITPEQIKKIFAPFIQAEAGTMRKFGGSGLGLVITKNLIELMGGTLSLESTPGLGSKFSFELTFNAVSISSEKETTDRFLFDNNLKKPLFEGEILVCEDNAMNQQVLCEHLAQVGIKTEIAHNGEQGVAIIQNRAQKGEKQFDLIFMDIHMPVMDGIEAAEKILALNLNVPIVAMTANVMTDDREIYLSVGMSDCVSKPFTSQVLWRCLTKFINPVRWEMEVPERREQVKNELHQELINIFVKNNRKKFDEIHNALYTENITLAHRLAHTLKSNAAQLHKTPLMKAAWEVETGLKKGINEVSPAQMETLKMKLDETIAELKPLVHKKKRAAATGSLDGAAVRNLLDKLEITLKSGNPECLMFINDLQLIPGTEELIQQMEDFSFDTAMKTLAKLKGRILVSR